MACKRSAVRSRLPPPLTVSGTPFPEAAGRKSERLFAGSPSSRGLGHDPFTVVTGVRIPLGTPLKINGLHRRLPPIFRVSQSLSKNPSGTVRFRAPRSLLAATVDCARFACAAPFARALADARIGLALQWFVAFFRVCDADSAAESGRIAPLTFTGNDARR